MSSPGTENQFSKAASEMKIPLQLDNKDYGKKSKVVARKITNKSSGDGKVYGSRAIMTKEHQAYTFSQHVDSDAMLVREPHEDELALPHQETTQHKMRFIDHLLIEQNDNTSIPEVLFNEIKSNVSKGAKDLEQQWEDALELTHKAYQVANTRRPLPTDLGAWKQYEKMITHAVQALTKTRGIDGKWRKSTVMYRENQNTDDEYRTYPQSDSHIGKRRFFIEIPGEKAAELDATGMDEVIELMTNKFRRHGAKFRVEERSKTFVVGTVWVNDVKRDRIVIKEVS